MTAAQDSRAQLRERAIALYTPPFSYVHGYIYDANGRRVAEVHGWERIGDTGNAAALLDEVGALIAELLTAHWQASRAALSAEPVASRYRWILEGGRASRWETGTAELLANEAFIEAQQEGKFEMHALYAAPQPAAQERKPLTDAEVLKAADAMNYKPRDNRRLDFMVGWRKAEQAHGITGDPA